jgi:hypothetical protein
VKVDREKLDNDCLHFVVAPSRPGVRASEYANVLSKVERHYRQQGDDQVLQVPVLED